MFEQMIAPLKWELTDSFEFVGSPTREELKKGAEFGMKFAELIRDA